jgi:hypothetical protein
MTGRRVILDTMLWNYLGDDGTGPEFNAAAAKLGWTLVHPPSILLEVLRSSNESSRTARVAAMVDSGGRRLPSEAELCVNEFVSAVRRHRPRWFRTRTDMATINSFNRIWTHDVWEQAQKDSAMIHLWQNDLEPSIERSFAATQRINRKMMDRNRFQVQVPYNMVMCSLQRPDPRYFGGTWRSGSVEAWRVEIGQRYWEYLIGRPGRDADTVRDFLDSYIDPTIATADPDDFRTLWFDELTASAVKRDWLQSAVGYTQTAFKLSDSNVRDHQHSAYLVDADLFLSADRRLIEVLKIVLEQANFHLAKPCLVKPSPEQSRFEAILRAGELA